MPGELIDAAAARLKVEPGGLPGPAAEIVDPLGERLLFFHDHFGGGRRGGGPDVGDEIGDREIDLVADGRDDRDRRGGDRPGDGLLVKGP